jgi:uncharacterized repeat protein (TIGR01451 family)
VRIAMNAAATIVPPGGAVTLFVTATNAGPDPATNVQIETMLPAGLVFSAATPSAGAFDPVTGVWTLPALPVGGAQTLELTANVTQTGPITPMARRVAQTEVDPVPANDASGVTINDASADLQIVATVDRTVVPVGTIVTFTITATNHGPASATGVQIRDALPAGLSYAGSSASQGLYVPETTLWTVGTLDAPGVGTVSRFRATTRPALA